MNRTEFNKKNINQLFDAFIALENREECQRFFDELYTEGEVAALAERLQVAKLLLQNKTYVEIEEETKASTVTISRVSKSIAKGLGGYKYILEKIK